MDLARQDRRVSGKVLAPAVVQATATLVLAVVEGVENGATLGMAVATILTAFVGWLKADCRYVTLRQQIAVPRVPAPAREGHLDTPD